MRERLCAGALLPLLLPLLLLLLLLLWRVCRRMHCDVRPVRQRQLVDGAFDFVALRTCVFCVAWLLGCAIFLFVGGVLIELKSDSNLASFFSYGGRPMDEFWEILLLCSERA